MRASPLRRRGAPGAQCGRNDRGCVPHDIFILKKRTRPGRVPSHFFLVYNLSDPRP
eukprot:gene13982-biopygen14141